MEKMVLPEKKTKAKEQKIILISTVCVHNFTEFSHSTPVVVTP